MAPHAHAVAAGAATLCAILALAGGCDHPGKREAAAVLSAVDQYRHAENPAKAARAEAVVSVTCTAPDVCAAKEACLGAISPTVQALALKDQVAALLADIEAQQAQQAQRAPLDAAATTDLPAKLDEAERLLKEGHANMASCETALAGLRLRYGN